MLYRLLHFGLDGEESEEFRMKRTLSRSMGKEGTMQDWR